MMMLQASPPLRRAIILAALLAALLLDWQPSPAPVARVPQRREGERPLPDPGEVRLQAARASRTSALAKQRRSRRRFPPHG
jgi:hypothetical protein